jgi:hypothetical protein
MLRSQSLFQYIRWVPLAAGLAGLLAIGGCGTGKIPLYPVTGTVMVDGKPAEGAMVILCPTEGSDEFKRERPTGTTASDGKFLLTTFVRGDGAPAGKYVVLVMWNAPASQVVDSRDGPSLGPDRLRGRYMNLGKSPLSATVNESATDLTPFDLKSK